MNASYITPSITLFHQDGSLDLDSQKSLYENLIANHIDGILALGSIGEFFAMPLAQRRELAFFAIEQIHARTKCIIGTSSMLTEEIVPFSNECLAKGADAVMIISPYYFRFDDETQFEYFHKLLGQIRGPVYLYNFPDRTGYSLSAATVLRLAQAHENLIGIKDTLSGMDHTRELIKALKPRFPDFEIYSGFDDNAAHNVLAGGDGVIGGLSNFAPEVCHAWIDALRRDDAEAILKGQQAVDRLFDIYSIGPLFVPIIKEAARLRGITTSSLCTFPILPPTTEQTRRIRELLSREGLLP